MSKAHIDQKLRSEGRCRLCRRASHIRLLTRHRLVPGSHGGRYVAVNVIPLCRPCHDLVDARSLDVRRSARRMLRASLWPVEVAHARSRRFWRHPLRPFAWNFDQAYPRPAREMVLERRREVASVQASRHVA